MKGIKKYFNKKENVFFTTIIDKRKPDVPIEKTAIATAKKGDFIIENDVLYVNMTFLSKHLKDSFLRLYSTSMLDVKPVAMGEVGKNNKVKSFEIKYCFVDSIEIDPAIMEKEIEEAHKTNTTGDVGDDRSDTGTDGETSQTVDLQPKGD